MYLDDCVKVRKPLLYWRELLQEWTFLVHRVYRVSAQKSAVHAEKERANTGLLAAAATRNGWIALEECRTQKSNKHLNTLQYSGRCDLVLWRDSRHHEIEAKFTRIKLGARTKNRIDMAYSRALADSSRSTYSGYRSERKVAVSYIVPAESESKLEGTPEEVVADKLWEMICHIDETYRPTFMAYAFPGPVKMEGNPNLALGTILVGQVT